MRDAIVTVLVPFYNQERFVAEAVESVLAQDVDGLHVVLTDDGSTDGTVEAMRAYADRDERITAVTSPRNTGISGNFNRGLAAVRGRYVAWLGGDDVMLPGRLERQLAHIEAHPEAVVSVHDAEVFDDATGARIGSFTDVYNGGAPLRDGGVELIFDATYHMLPSATLVRTEAMPAHGFDPRLRIANDLLWYAEVLRHGRVVALHEELVRYRRHGENMTAAPEIVRTALEEQLVALAIVTARYPELAALARRRATALMLLQARTTAAAGRWADAARYASAAAGHGGPAGAAREAARLLGRRLRERSLG